MFYFHGLCPEKRSQNLPATTLICSVLSQVYFNILLVITNVVSTVSIYFDPALSYLCLVPYLILITLSGRPHPNIGLHLLLKIILVAYFNAIKVNILRFSQTDPTIIGVMIFFINSSHKLFKLRNSNCDCSKSKTINILSIFSLIIAKSKVVNR